MTRVLPALLAMAALAWAAPARAATPISGVIELKLGSYHPQIDRESGIQSYLAQNPSQLGPYQAAFQDHHILLLQLEWERQFFQRFGSLAGGLSVGYGEVYGHGYYDVNGPELSRASDTTALKVVPLKGLVIYRFDVLAKRYNVPLVPYAKLGLVYELWRITNGSGDTATSGTVTTNAQSFSSGEGGNWGWEGDLGLALDLGWFDEALAKDMDIDLGVNHIYFFGEYSDMSAIRSSPISAPDRLRLNDEFWNFGLAFEY